jgi:hypothetical protein
MSANGRTLSQATASKQPAYISSAWRGFAAARFDGSNHVMSASAPTGIANTTQFLVGKWNAGGASQDLALGYGQASDGSKGRWFYRATNGTRLGFATWGNDLLQSASTQLDISGGYHVWGVQQNDKYLLLSVDGKDESNTIAATPLNTVSAIWQLGGTTGSASYFTSIDVLEVIAFPVALSTADFHKVLSSLSWKYQLQSQLTASHTYRNRPPLIGD